MDRQTLEQYRDILSEIADLSDRLETQHRSERVSDTVQGSDPRWPYHKRVFKIEGKPRKRSPAVCSLESLYREEVTRLNAVRLEIEQWITEIPDSRTRKVFRRRYIDGWSFADIAAADHWSESTVRIRIHDGYLRKCTENTD